MDAINCTSVYLFLFKPTITWNNQKDCFTHYTYYVTKNTIIPVNYTDNQMW